MVMMAMMGDGDDDDEMSVSLVEETGAPWENHRPTAFKTENKT